jgi:hypothetical protein
MSKLIVVCTCLTTIPSQGNRSIHTFYDTHTDDSNTYSSRTYTLSLYTYLRVRILLIHTLGQHLRKHLSPRRNRARPRCAARRVRMPVRGYKKRGTSIYQAISTPTSLSPLIGTSTYFWFKGIVCSKLSVDVSRLGRGPCYDVLVRYTVGTRCIDVFDVMLVRRARRLAFGTDEMN